jgi:hypothetical protein
MMTTDAYQAATDAGKGNRQTPTSIEPPETG